MTTAKNQHKDRKQLTGVLSAAEGVNQERVGDTPVLQVDSLEYAIQSLIVKPVRIVRQPKRTGGMPWVGSKENQRRYR